MKNRFISRSLLVALLITMLGFVVTSSCTASKRMGGCPMSGKMSGYR